MNNQNTPSLRLFFLKETGLEQFKLRKLVLTILTSASIERSFSALIIKKRNRWKEVVQFSSFMYKKIVYLKTHCKIQDVIDRFAQVYNILRASCTN